MFEKDSEEIQGKKIYDCLPGYNLAVTLPDAYLGQTEEFARAKILSILSTSESLTPTKRLSRIDAYQMFIQ